MKPRLGYQLSKRTKWQLLLNIPLALGLIIGVNNAHALPSKQFITDHGKYPSYPKVDYSTGNKELIKKGEYLVKAGHCIACHTAPGSKEVFAGGNPLDTPFGIIYPPNITPDKETGIGNWTDADFIKAVHHGISPVTGRSYLPAFPFTFFTRITKPDLIAIHAYLKAIPPVKKKNKPMDIPFPFSWTFLQWGWKALYFEPGYFKPDPKRSKEWNRGAYLVTGLAFCGACHTPRNALGGRITSKALSGAMVDGYYAPNITSSPDGVGKYSIQDIMNVFLKDEMLGNHGKVQGPMAEVDHDSLMYLNKSDLRAIAVYLKSTKPVTPKKSTSKATMAQAKTVYDNTCATCHANGAAGAPIVGDYADWHARIKANGLKGLYKHAIYGLNSMPPKGTCVSCSDALIEKIVDYMVEESDTPGGGAKKPTGPKPLTMADGKKLYEEHCSLCHSPGKAYKGAPTLGDKKAWAPLIKSGVGTLIERSIHGYYNHPKMGACASCSAKEVEAAAVYMIQKGATEGNFKLWLHHNPPTK